MKNLKKTILATVTALTLTFASLPTITQAQGRQACAEYELVAERLAEKYGESVNGMGLTSNQSIIQVWSNPETGTWSITVTNAQGVACLVASGQAWEILEPTVTAPGDDL